jgi:hypothetical protein
MISTEDRDRYRRLLKSALDQPTDESKTPPAVQNFIVPSGHTRALDPTVELVRGGRGVGKSAWYLALTSPEHLARLHETASFEEVTAVHGFGAEPAIEQHPDRDILEAMLDRGASPRTIWRAVVLHQATRSPDDTSTWVQRVDQVAEDPEHFARRMHEADVRLGEEGTTLLILFDALDRTARAWNRRRELLTSLLEVLLDLKGYRRIRGKAFVRPDMLDYGGVLAFPDASKLTARAVDLEWRPRDLYRLLWQRLGNSAVEEASWFRKRTGKWEEQDGIFLPPKELLRTEERQREVFHEITGPYMGRNHRRGYPYTWLPKHLADSRQQVSPRSFLIALDAAVRDTIENREPHEWPLHWESIKGGVQKASEGRVAEIKEDVGWIDIALGPLEGLSVPCAVEDIDARWRTKRTLAELENLDAERQPQRVADGASGLRDELASLGILEPLSGERVNMADVYRVAFRLGRKGGVKPL